MRPCLTDTQRDVLDFIQSTTVAKGYGPTIREIGRQFGWGPNGVMCHLRALERKGQIIRDPLVSRGIRLPNLRLAYARLRHAGTIG